MPSAKRKQRRKTTDNADNATADNVESSPSHPTAKRRKQNGARSSRTRNSMPAPAPKHVEDSGDDSETVSTGDFIDSIICYLNVSKEPIVAASEYSNEKEQPDTQGKIPAYAKIAGRDWTYFVQDQSVNIGRPPDGVKEQPGLPFGASSPTADLKEILPVNIDLGPSKIVSRHHASIYYDSEFPKDGGWHIRVNGRNGVKVNNVTVKRGGRVQVHSGVIFEIAGTQMMFVTPGDKASIHPMFVERAKAMATGEEFGLSHAHPDGDDDFPEAENMQYPPIGSYHSLAPAPPDFKRTTTPPPQEMRNGRGMFDSRPTQSPMYNRGMMMESTHEIDYSKDAARDLKPPYSYATMIAQAIFSSDEEKLTLSNIYGFIAEKYAFYRHSSSGWQNSIRHNLSLNKAFQKVPRRTDEPGKGMKWQIAPEYRQEYWKKQQRKGGTSSNPSSPAGKEVNPNFRGPNGQNLGYDTTMVNQFSAKDMTEQQSLANRRDSHMNFQPLNLGQPGQLRGPPMSQEAFTPQRRRTDTMTTEADPNLEDSPLPHAHARQPLGQSQQPVYTFPPTNAPQIQYSPSNPTFSSSLLDTPYPAHPSGPGTYLPSNTLTPAPLRQNPRLAPPSTLVAPSKYMPESSPAGPGLFWNRAFAGGFGATPAAPPPDLSPDKVARDAKLEANRNMMSSSPPPVEHGEGSPTKFKSSFRSSQGPSFGPLSTERKINGLPMSNGGNGHVTEAPPPPFGQNGFAPSDGGRHSISGPNTIKHDTKEDEDDDSGGFDLARGFAPIGSRAASAAATR